MSFPDRVKSSLQKNIGVDFGDRRYLIAVSGGRDSMALLAAFCELVPREQLGAAHFNHRQRGARSLADERFVERECRRRGVPSFSERAIASEFTSEAKMRQARWAFLEETRVRIGADFVATAHHLEDQWETVVLRLLRGTGARGFTGMKALLRARLKPCLDIPREEIDRYVEVEGLAFQEDLSNSETRFLRNQVRWEITPRVKKVAEAFGGWSVFLGKFSATLEDLRWDRHQVEKHARHLERRLFRKTHFWIRVRESRWQALAPDWQRELLRRLYRKLGARIPTRSELGQALQRLEQKQRHATLAGKVEAEASCGWLFFHSDRQRRCLAKVRVTSRKVTSGWRASCSQLGLEIEGSVPGKCRFPRPGDRVGRRKLKQCLLKDRVPAPERRFLPVVAEHNSGRVLWYFPKQNKQINVKAMAFPFSFLDAP